MRIGGKVVVGLENGSLFDNFYGDILPYQHQSQVTQIYYNITSMRMITGDATGQIIVSSGNLDTTFSFKFSYHEHSCQIISIIVCGENIITSDGCGYIVQYDTVKRAPLDKISHPGRTGDQKVILSQWMDGDFGVSGVENQPSVYLYRISDSKTGDHLDIKLVTAAGTIASIPALRIMIKASMPLLVWLEDFYPYTHHLHPYNDGIKLFLLTLHEISQERINPSLGFIAEKQFLSNNLTFNVTPFGDFYPLKNLAEDAYFHLHFLEYTKSLYVENLIAQLTAFVLIKIAFTSLLRRLTDPKIVLVLAAFEGNTCFWLLPMVLLGDNLLYLSFASAAQFRTTFSFAFAHKANLAAAILCFFFLLQYSLVYFLLIDKFLRPRFASNALYQCQHSLKGFMVEGCLFGVRNLINGFIHGFLLDRHELQIILLIANNSLMLLVMFLLRKEFTYKVAYWLGFLYYLGFILFNGLVLMEIRQVDIGGISYSWIGYRWLYMLFGLACLRAVFEVGVKIKDMMDRYRDVCVFMKKLERKEEERMKE